MVRVFRYKITIKFFKFIENNKRLAFKAYFHKNLNILLEENCFKT